MEAARGLISSPPALNPPRNHSRSPFSTSVPVLHDQTSRAVSSMPTMSVVRHFPASVLSHEQRDDYKTSYSVREEKPSQHEESGLPFSEEKEKYNFEQYLKHFERRLLHQPGFWYLCHLPHHSEKPVTPTSVGSVTSGTNGISSVVVSPEEQNNVDSVRLEDVLALANRAMIASRRAASLAEESVVLESEFNESDFIGLDVEDSIIGKEILIDEPTIRSKRRLERRLKKRKASKKPSDDVYKVASSMAMNISKKLHKNHNQNDPLGLFLGLPETKQLLTVKEEKVLFAQIQDLMRLNEAKERLCADFNREPTVAEWAQAVGMSCHDLQSSLLTGIQSRDRLVYANFLLVVHIARQYEGKGLSIQDLLQEGSMGLMKSLEKFKPKAGSRFPSYAYWWIRQSIRKAIFLKSRIIRLPENIYALLKTIRAARRSCIQEGRVPTKEELARRVGITVEKLQNTLALSRNPISIQERPWADQDVTLQEITADPVIETPELSVSKHMMRQHIRNLLSHLSPREREIIQWRFGINNSKPMTLSEIGNIYGLSKERVRQVETHAMNKLKSYLPTQGLQAYAELLT
ncbi:RNA polymerase sigma factor sigF, chloroplastic [Dioscorea cayenensis subsp. rotundata]|uniref:RNA polymerase sigma factor sigF, chloroplastic n=1 Tax=Dioscorea cayennensis subsp. rotundata TaxID=55577 RepID=A0AB40CET4_DIOCR|nr:RNA polymerase sigma factor sigF, chloroplastic [Dioscorea cayenensis subsp. rotundata]